MIGVGGSVWAAGCTTPQAVNSKDKVRRGINIFFMSCSCEMCSFIFYVLASNTCLTPWGYSLNDFLFKYVKKAIQQALWNSEVWEKDNSYQV